MKLVRSDWIVPLLAALLSFLGAVAGALVAGSYQHSIWQEQVTYERQKQRFEQRIRLLERTSRIEQSIPLFQIYNEYVQQQVGLERKFVQCREEKDKSCQKPVEAENHLQVSTKLAEMGAEYASATQLSGVYFGAGVRSELAKLSAEKYWWFDGSKPLWRAVIAEMGKEIVASTE